MTEEERSSKLNKKEEDLQRFSTTANQSKNISNRSEFVEGGMKSGDASFLAAPIPVIRLSKTLTSKTFSSDGSCQFLPEGKVNCQKHNHKKIKLQKTQSEGLIDRAEAKSLSSAHSNPYISLDNDQKPKSFSEKVKSSQQGPTATKVS